MDLFDVVEPVMDGERALRATGFVGAPPLAAQKRLVGLLIALRE